jgi:hypothetical protein
MTLLDDLILRLEAAGGGALVDDVLDAVDEAVQQEREEGRARFFVTYPWHQNRLFEITDGVVDVLLDLAKQDRKEDFMFMAGSSGVPVAEQGVLWEGTRRRLGL